MFKVFVIGGSGFLGEEIALAVRRAGHSVTCLVRDKSRATTLLLGEIQLAVGDIYNLDSWVPVAKQHNVIINAGADYNNFEKYERAVVEGIQAATANTGTTLNGQKKIVIYTSGTFVIRAKPAPKGQPYAVLSDDDPIETEGFGALRQTYAEPAVMGLTNAYGMVIRPGKVFGKRSTHYAQFFAGAAAGSVKVTAPNAVCSSVHVEDLAQAYVRVLATPPSVWAGHAICIANSDRVTDMAIAQAFAGAADFKGKIEIDEKSANPFLDRTHVVSVEKAFKLLGWRGTRSMITDVGVMYTAWLAAQQPTTGQAAPRVGQHIGAVEVPKALAQTAGNTAVTKN